MEYEGRECRAYEDNDRCCLGDTLMLDRSESALAHTKGTEQCSSNKSTAAGSIDPFRAMVRDLNN